MARPAAIAHGGKFTLLYIRRKLAQKCHNNSRKKKERVVKERGWSSEALPVLRFIVSISTISILRNRI
jgi:hypothetical protein